MKKLLSLCVLCGVLLAGCGSQTESSSIQPAVQPVTEQVTETETLPETEPETELETEPETETETQGELNVKDFKTNQMNLAVTLLQKQMEQDANQNVLISPLSISTALALTANGADGETLNQMQNFFGEEIASLNTDLKEYTENLYSDEKSRCISANAVWINQNGKITVKDDFLKTADEVYQAGVFEEVFTPATKDSVNSWVNEHTENMIENMIDRVDENDIMYLVNALTFDAQWSDQYDDYQIEDDMFTAFDGSERTVSMMTAKEHIYLDDGKATGFMKAYKGGYSFVALLPNEDTDIQSYVNSLDAEALVKLLNEPQFEPVITDTPAFESDYSTSLKDTLQALGMKDAFSRQNADFSAMAETTNPEDNIFISDVLHKTYISVDKNGTKAAAATAVVMGITNAAREEEPPKEVILNRPFVYMIVDSRENLPLFIGTVMDIK